MIYRLKPDKGLQDTFIDADILTAALGHNWTWLIGCDEPRTLYLCVFIPSVQQNAQPRGYLWIGFFVCPCRSNPLRQTLWPCVLSRLESGLRLPARLLFALAANKSADGGGMHGVDWEVAWRDAGRWRWYSILRYTSALCSNSMLVIPKGRDQVYLTTFAFSSTQHAPPGPDKICMRHSLQHDPTPCKTHRSSPHSICLLWHTWLNSVKTDMACSYECDNINQLLKKISKISETAVRSPSGQKIMFHDCSTILLWVTDTPLLSLRSPVTLKATESKQPIIYEKTTLCLFYSLLEIHFQGAAQRCANSSGGKFEFEFTSTLVVQIKLSRFVIFAVVNSYSMGESIYHCQSHDSFNAIPP